MKSLAIILALSVQVALGSGYIVKLKADKALSSDQALSLFQTNDVSLNQLSIGTYYVVNLKEVGAAEISRLKNDPRVEYVVKNEIIKIDPMVTDPAMIGEGEDGINDPDFTKQWALKNDGKNGTKAGVDLDALESWNVIKGDKKIKIAVIDTGVDYNHPDLKDNMFINEAEANGKPGVDDDGNGFVDDIHGYDFANGDGDPMDDNKHGTHCAGIIAATHNDLGIRGIMKDVSIVAVKFLTARGGGKTMDAVKAIDYAVKMGVDIMSNSWGSPASSGAKKGRRGEPKFNKAIMDAVKRAEEAGIVFVAAAGNSKMDTDKTPFSPANIPLPNVIAVGSIESGGKRSSFSNYGAQTVHVMAPGSSIHSTVPGDKYASLSGTSMAAPYVSGIAGLILALEPTLTPTEVKQRLISTSLPQENLKSYSISKGRVSALRAVQNITN